MTTSVPVIDLTGLRAGASGAVEDTARQVQAALTTVGFFLITGHGVPPALIERTFAEAKRFHDQPMAWKAALKMNQHNNGYMALGRYAVWTSEVNQNDKPDLNEAFFIRRERAADDPLLLSGRRFAGSNVWPREAELPGFRANLLEYTEAVDALAHRFLPAVAVALDLPPGWFAPFFGASMFSLRLSHYPPAAPEANQFGIAPHSDANFLTFLAQTGVPGLQLRAPDGAWVDVPYVPGSFAVNSGDIMRRWSNGRFKSTPHRALPPKAGHRYAIPFFFGPDFDAAIECLPTCHGPSDPPCWPPIVYGDWLSAWLEANYDPKVQQESAA